MKFFQFRYWKKMATWKWKKNVEKLIYNCRSFKTNHNRRRLIDFELHKINLDIVTIDLMEKTNKSVGDLWAR